MPTGNISGASDDVGTPPSSASAAVAVPISTADNEAVASSVTSAGGVTTGAAPLPPPPTAAIARSARTKPKPLSKSTPGTPMSSAVSSSAA